MNFGLLGKIITRFLVILFIHGIEIVMMKYLFLILEKANLQSVWVNVATGGGKCMEGCIDAKWSCWRRYSRRWCHVVLTIFWGGWGCWGVDLCACIKTIKLNCGSTSLVVAIELFFRYIFFSFWYNWNKMHLGKNCYPKIISTNWN